MRMLAIALFTLLTVAPVVAQDLKYVDTIVDYDDSVIMFPNRLFFGRLKEECGKQSNITWYLKCKIMVDVVHASALRMVDSEVDALRYKEFMEATRQLLERFPALRIVILPST